MDAVCHGCQAREQKMICGNCFMERQIGWKQRDARLGRLTWQERPVKRSLFLLAMFLTMCIGVQYASCFMKRQIGERGRFYCNVEKCGFVKFDHFKKDRKRFHLNIEIQPDDNPCADSSHPTNLIKLLCGINFTSIFLATFLVKYFCCFVQPLWGSRPAASEEIPVLWNQQTRRSRPENKTAISKQRATQSNIQINPFSFFMNTTNRGIASKK